MQSRILRNYTRLPKQVKASLWFVVSNVMVKGISFITLPIFSRLLTTEEFGVVSVYHSWVSVISIISTLTIWGGGFNVGMVKYNEKKYEMISSFQGMAIILTTAFGFISAIAFPLLQPILKMSSLLTLCMFLEILGQIPFFLWSTEQRYIFEYKKLILITIIISILNPAISVIAVLNASNKAEARIICGAAISLFVGVFFFFYNQHRGRVFFNKEFWKFGFSFNIVLVPHYLSMQVLNQSDRIMINNMCGSSDAGIYSVAYTFALLLSLITSGINSSLTPHIYQSIKTGKGTNLKEQTTAVIAIVAAISVVLIAIIPDVFHLMLPESYYEAIKVIPPVATGAFFLFLYPLFGSVEFYFEENKYVTYASLIGAVLNIGLNYYFIKMFGFVAAAYTTLFCYICFSVCHYLFMKKIMKKRGLNAEIYDIKKISFISISLTLFSIIMVLVYDITVIRWLIIFVAALLGVVKRKLLISVFTSLRKPD